MSENNIKGAEWRKWDLHIHSNASDGKSTPEEIINEAKLKGLSVIALTDHHTAKNIDIIKEIGKKEGISVISGIEFRTEYGQKSVHLIGLFPNNYNGIELTASALHDLILSPLELSETKIISKGIDEKSSRDNENAFKQGMFLVQVDFKKAANLIHKYGGVVSVHAGSKANSFDTEMRHLGSSLKNVTELFDSLGTVKEELLNQGYIDICEIRKENDSAKFYLENYGKPSIIASDAHTKELIGEKFTWVKADPNFEGLLQIINEPSERVFIGEQPDVLKRIELNRTKYIKELVVSKENGYNGSSGVWFNDITIPLNSELVAIIGNKGSGKSAIADIISLCSNYYDNNDFSFLNSKKFREKNGRIAKNFSATLVWQSDHKSIRNLNDTPDNSEIKAVKYIPQGQFEKLTNEISSAAEFQKEIEKVVFSHIDDAEKFGAQTFSELVEMKTRIVEIEQKILYDKIKSVNEEIIKLENKETKFHFGEVSHKLENKQDELKSLIEPSVVDNPNDDPIKKNQNQEINDRIDKINRKINVLTRLKNIKEVSKRERSNKLKSVTDVKSEIKIKIEEFDNFIISISKELMTSCDIDINSIFELKFDFSSFDILISKLECELKNIKISLGDIISKEDKLSIPELIAEENLKLNTERDKLNEEQNIYHSYLISKKTWEDNCRKITGDKFTLDTIEFYKSELDYLSNQLKIDIDSKYNERKEIVRKIFRNKQSVVDVYKEIKNKLSEIIAENSDTLKNYKIEVDASIVNRSDFNNTFLLNIQQNKAGTFFSKEGAEQQLSSMTLDVDFDNEDSVINFLDTILKSLKLDMRDVNRVSREIKDQVRDVNLLYSYLFNLEFLDYKYKLKQGNKEIEQLSPGERGALLLVFYLLLDKNDIPLIIDQPEDNLDNESVATILVPFIRAAKKKRQIILVTHNPNLAVVADAEQIIYVDLDKEDNYTFSLISGSIENIIVNRKIVKVLEGAMPAFKKRKQKYYDN